MTYILDVQKLFKNTLLKQKKTLAGLYKENIYNFAYLKNKLL